MGKFTCNILFKEGIKMSNRKFKKATTYVLVASLLINTSVSTNADEVAVINQNLMNVFHVQPVQAETIEQGLSIKDIKSKISNVFNPKQSLSQDFYQEQERANINLREVIGEWNCGENAKAKLESGSGVLTISGTGAMNSYSLRDSNPAPWYDNKYKSYINSIVIEEGITSIGNFAFYDCEALSLVLIPKSVKHIGDSAFLRCASLSNIEIPENVESIGAGAFGATALSELVIPNSVVEIKEGAFRACKDLKCLKIGSGVTTIRDYAFADCSNLYSISFKGAKEPGYNSKLLPFNNIYKKVDKVYVLENYEGEKFCNLEIKKKKENDADKCRNELNIKQNISKGLQITSFVLSVLGTFVSIVVGIGTLYSIHKTYKNSKEIGTLNKMLEAMNPTGGFGNQCQQVAQNIKGIEMGVKNVF